MAKPTAELWWLARAAEFRVLHARAPHVFAERRNADGTVERLEQVNLRSAEMCEAMAKRCRDEDRAP